ncbi:MAG TPA: hypothetical protein VGM89_04285, partial [Puia sp.]
MPKDIHGKYHPPKGKPSDTRKEETNEELKDELKGDEHLDHPNRNTSKKRDKSLPREERQQDEPKHGRTGRVVKSETGEVMTEAQEEGLIQRIEATDPMKLREKFVELAKFPADVCVSIYLGG